ncbi:MAG: metallophosphoesterase family protein [Clostridia bacterium]|nr:metallophosphoesterase family protein [Clostridia bacterium]
MKLGILSDTHGLLRQEVLDRLAGCDAILHGGDINNQGILDTLASVAPVYAVRGNNDREWAASLPEALALELGGARLYMTHKKKDLPDGMDGYDLVVVGHSHRYELQRLGGTLLINPGSCGPRRFNQAITMALAEITPSPAGRPRIAITRIDIEHQGPRRRISGDLKSQIETVIRETAKGRPAVDIAARRGWDVALVEQIARLYVTHPGVDADGIMAKMGL